MTTTYYVVPAGRFFDSTRDEEFPNRKMAEHDIAHRKADGDDADYGIFEVRLVAGIGMAPWGDAVHVRDGRKFIVSRAWRGGWQAYCDDMGADGSPYGYGKTPEEAIADCLEQIADAEERRATQSDLAA